jgi:hypothetical protein
MFSYIINNKFNEKIEYLIIFIFQILAEKNKKIKKL